MSENNREIIIVDVDIEKDTPITDACGYQGLGVTSIGRKRLMFGAIRSYFAIPQKETSSMKNIAVIFFVIALFTGIAPLAYADCVSNGKSYPPGTVIGGFICTPDGRWVRV